MPVPEIENSVGEDGTNNPSDVIIVQQLLNILEGAALIEVNGICGLDTIEAIHKVQRDFFNGSDGLIEPKGPTFKRILAAIEKGYKMLPQVSLTSATDGYYSYSPSRKQYGTPTTIDTLLEVAQNFHLIRPDLRIGIGDMSLRDGAPHPPHTSHRNGRNTDIRPLRHDGAQTGVKITDIEYDRGATRLLVQILLTHPNVKRILFNDTEIEGVKFFQGHHNHLHVESFE
jgi:hypothetical protein